jgi:hypothetical protein
MPSDPWKRLRLASLSLLALACSAPELVRFPEGRPVLWRDDDTRPFHTECQPDPEEAGHLLCVPETYVSPFAWDAVDNSVFLPISRALAVPPAREAINVNSLDEVPDSSWFQNRIGRFGMTPAELLRGPCEGGPTLDPGVNAASWLIDQGKPNGANPGFRIRSEERGKFMLKADLGGEPERATAAAAIAARLYYAAGYFTPCDSVIYLHPSLLKLKPELKFADNSGVERPFDQAALDQVLGNAARRGDRVRMSASRWLPGRPIGPFTYSGVREDDPNDVIPHEHRRELRGARLFAAWLNHFDSREQNSMNTWLAEDQSDPDSTPGHVRHWYLDFGDCFGSQWDWDTISRRLGHAHYLDFGYLTTDFLTLGLIERPWDRARLTDQARIFGYFSARDFEPEKWRGGYPNPAFAEMTERDGAWAARVIARFTPRHVEAAVSAGDLTNPAHSRFLTDTLVARRAAILRRYLTRLSPLADVAVEGRKLCANDLARGSGVFEPRQFQYAARAYAGEQLAALGPFRVQVEAARVCVELPRAPARARSSQERYLVVDLANGLAPGPLRAHLYDRGALGYELAGLERPEDDQPPAL